MKAGLKRIQLLDGLRGGAILGMIVHHAAFDLENFYDFSLPFFHSAVFHYLQLFFVLIFVLTSGICTGFSRSSLRRGGIVLGVGMGLTIFTMLFLPQSVILFGILHFMGSAMIIYGLVQKYLCQIPWHMGFLVFAVLFAVSFYFFGFFGIRINIPYLFALGLPETSFFSADYYPLIPWIFAYFSGTYLSKPILDFKFPKWFYEIKVPILAPTGRYSLYVFVLHQPILYAIMYLILGKPSM